MGLNIIAEGYIYPNNYFSMLQEKRLILTMDDLSKALREVIIIGCLISSCWLLKQL